MGVGPLTSGGVAQEAVGWFLSGLTSAAIGGNGEYLTVWALVRRPPEVLLKKLADGLSAG
jgi:hypothetical protein